MSKILKLREALVKNKPSYPFNYAIPDLFNLFGHNPITRLKNGEQLVNPFDYLIDLIDHVLLDKYEALPVQSLSSIRNEHHKFGGDWIIKSTVYSMMIRTSSAWDHDRNGYIDENNVYHLKETGTFLKTLMLLPMLKKMGVDTIYLLPISKFSLKNKKGELGSPYGVSNFFELDSSLSDPMIENDLSLDEQFQVLVEAIHTLGMRVMIDIIPRTNATENDLIIDHPDWFYWIKSADMPKYKPPYVHELLEKTVSPVSKYMPTVYQSKEVLDHISLFQFDPKTQDKELWKKLEKEYRKNRGSILELIDTYYGLTIAPAFSDHINDIQPPWTDVTFFRMYLDHPRDNQQYLTDQNIPPYILFDTIKSNLYPGNKPNTALWDTLANIIPHYQKTYGIDGARIDMGHALPKELVEQIISTARKIDPDFAFIAEELNPDNAKTARPMGYNMIIGNGFSMEHKVFEGNLHRFMYESVLLDCPVFACGETHDTPRLAARDGGQNLSKFLTVMNMFMPNGVPFINSGQEVYERQPMNTGIDPRPNELYMLDSSDPYYMKLALFDKFAIHYLNHMSKDILDNLSKVSPIRQAYLDVITNKKNYLPISFTEGYNPIGFAYEAKNEILLIVGNANPYEAQHTKVDLRPIRQKFNLVAKEAKLLYAMHELEPRMFFEFDENGNPYFFMGAGEVKILVIQK
ncbi:MAG: alpha-amylase family glycosyl hydrolase [Paracholeplasma sp.]|nr:alpha-amylase family glycosyl hydrolase [Paracholeplasma sp.]MDY3196266.1 alpha-amylase family glycosyl hydrolase [Paracholeplasma sp.]